MAERPKTGYEARKAAVGAGASQAYTQTNVNPLDANIYNADNIYSKIYYAPDNYARDTVVNQLYRTFMNTTTPSGNLFNDLQNLLRSTGFSKGKTAIGIVDPKDTDGLIEAIGGAIQSNSPDLLSYLSAIQATGGRGTDKEIKQPDTTTKFTRQVTSSLQMLDIGDATKKFTDDFFITYGVLPNSDSIQAFRKAWNAEVRTQRATTTTETVTKMAKVYDKKSDPIIDKKTGQQKLDKFGQPMYSRQLKNAEGVLQYKPIVSQDTLTKGQGFTAEEQAEFMADYLVANFPDIADAEDLGGAAKTIYDAVVKLDQDNYREVSNFATIAPVIKDFIGSGRPEVAQEYLRQYTDKIRKDAATKYMAVAQNLKDGQNVAELAKPLMDEVSAVLETSVDIKDPLVVQMLNYQAPNGEYRLPNEFEKMELLKKDSRFQRTSTAINNAVNVAQTLRSRLQG